MMMRSIAGSEVKSWGLRLMRRKGRRRAVVAAAKNLAVIMHRMWADGTDFRHESLKGSSLTGRGLWKTPKKLAVQLEARD